MTYLNIWPKTFFIILCKLRIFSTKILKLYIFTRKGPHYGLWVVYHRGRGSGTPRTWVATVLQTAGDITAKQELFTNPKFQTYTKYEKKFPDVKNCLSYGALRIYLGPF